MRAVLTGVLLTIAAAGCSPGGETEDPSPQYTTQVVVENNNWLDVNVYAIRDGMRRRLGTVTTNSTRRFRLPRAFVATGGEVRLLVDPIGSSQTRMMPPVAIMGGDRIDLDVFNHLPLSSISVLPSGRW